MKFSGFECAPWKLYPRCVNCHLRIHIWLSFGMCLWSDWHYWIKIVYWDLFLSVFLLAGHEPNSSRADTSGSSAVNVLLIIFNDTWFHMFHFVIIAAFYCLKDFYIYHCALRSELSVDHFWYSLVVHWKGRRFTCHGNWMWFKTHPNPSMYWSICTLVSSPCYCLVPSA